MKNNNENETSEAVSSDSKCEGNSTVLQTASNLAPTSTVSSVTPSQMDDDTLSNSKDGGDNEVNDDDSPNTMSLNASVDHTYSSSSDTSAQKNAANDSPRAKKRKKTSNDEVSISDPVDSSMVSSTSTGKKQVKKPDLESSDANDATPTCSSSSTSSSSADVGSTESTTAQRTAKEPSVPKVPALRIVISSTSSSSATVTHTVSSVDAKTDCHSSNVTSSGDDKGNNDDTNSGSEGEAQSSSSSKEASNSNSALISATISSSGRVTRSSQRAAAQQQSKRDIDAKSPLPKYSDNGGEGRVGTNKENDCKDSAAGKKRRKGPVPKNTQASSTGPAPLINEQEEDNESSSSSISSWSDPSKAGGASLITGTTTPKEFQMPSYNCYHLYLNIRKQIDKRRNQMFPVHPKPPRGFKDYLLNKGSYLLQSKVRHSSMSNDPRSSVKLPPLTPPPSSLKPGSPLYHLFIDQEKVRQKLRIQHMIEKEKLRLSAEQEVLRVYGRAALASTNQSLPFSFCTILKDEEIYNIIESNESSTSGETSVSSKSTINASGTCSSGSAGAAASATSTSAGSSGNIGGASSTPVSKNEYQKVTYTPVSGTNSTDLSTLTGQSEKHGSRSRYNGRLFSQWLQDVDDKWEKIKESALLRQRREAESLQAVQRLDWEWKNREVGSFNLKFNNWGKIDPALVPLVLVNDDFDLLPV